MIITVTLSDAEIAMAKMVGNLRTLVNKCANIKDPKHGPKKYDIDERGMIAEFAFCKYWNVFLDIVPVNRSGGYDCILNGKRFDIKATHYKDGMLLKPLKENDEVDCYALAIVDGNTVTFPGWAFQIELCQEKNIVNLGYEDSYGLEQSQLRQWKER